MNTANAHETIIHKVVRPSAHAVREIEIGKVAEALGMKRQGKRWHCWHPERHKHGDADPSASIQLATNRMHCFVCHSHASTIDLLMDHHHCTVGAAIRWLAKQYPGEASTGKWRQTYQVNRTRVMNKTLSDYGKLRSTWAGQSGKGKHSKKDRLFLIVNSEEWMQLSLAARVLWATLAGKIMPRGQPYVKGTILGVAKATGLRYKRTWKAKDELVKAGLLTVEHSDRNRISGFRLFPAGK